MKKKWIMILAVITLVAFVGIFIFGQTIGFQQVGAKAYRNGFLLKPDGSGQSGLVVDDTLTLRTKDNYEADQIQEMFDVHPQVGFSVTALTQQSFRITFEENLQHNKIYTFIIQEGEERLAHWAFQTTNQAKLGGFLPRHRSTGVPIDTGIEMYFTVNDVENIEQAFQITPHVSGKFQIHDKVVVFVPNEKLQPETVYTVVLADDTLMHGNTLIDGDTLQFETASEQTSPPYRGHIGFENFLYEFSSKESVQIPLQIYLPDDQSNQTIQSDVYRLDQTTQFEQVFEEWSKLPFWSQWNQKAEQVQEWADMTHMGSIEMEIRYQRNAQPIMITPESQMDKGIYMIHMEWEHGQGQVFFQVTDVSAFAYFDWGHTHVWAHDLQNGQPAQQANIEYLDQETTTDENGLAMIDNQQQIKTSQLMKVTHGEEITYVIHHPITSEKPLDHHQVFATDKNLYQPDETIGFFGYTSLDTQESNVTIELDRGYFMPMPRMLPGYTDQQKPLLTQQVPLENGFYQGALTLPHIQEGHYMLTIKLEGTIIKTQYIQVESYVTPAIELTVEPSEKGVFADHAITFDVKAAFFEGTPAQQMEIHYSISYEGTYESGTQKTDQSGQTQIEFTPKNIQGKQGRTSVDLNVALHMPEQGEIYAQSRVNVFLTNIDMNTKTEKTQDQLLLEGNAYILDIEEETGNGIEGVSYGQKPIEVILYENHWEKTKVGTRYDFIEKKTVDQYEYHVETKEVARRIGFTQNDGDFSYVFPYHEQEGVWYHYEIQMHDTNDKAFTKRGGFYRHYGYTYPSPSQSLTVDQEQYGLGDTVNVHYDEQAGSYLFVILQNGIKKTVVSQYNEFQFDFDKEDIPNVYVQAIGFTDNGYRVSNTQNVVFDHESREMDLKVTSEKTRYQPGDMVTLHIDGYPHSQVVLSVLDRALLSMRPYEVDFLAELFSHSSAATNRYYTTHGKGNSIDHGRYYPQPGMGSDDMAAPEMGQGDDAKRSGEQAIRSDFRDVAAFESVTLNQAGKASVSFKMPDNITGWVVFANGVSPDLYAGSQQIELYTTLDFFINPVLNQTFLTGDQAYIGITAYGDGLTQDDEIEFVVYAQSHPEQKEILTGKAFQRMYVPLPEMSMGNDFIIVQARANEWFDGVKLPIEVFDSFGTTRQSRLYTMDTGFDFETGTMGNTTLFIADMDHIRYISPLYRWTYYHGERLEGLVLNQQIIAFLNQYNDQEDDALSTREWDISKYQQADGGMGILPYAMSDVALSADLIEFVKDQIDLDRLINHLYLSYEREPTISALYGLAQLEEPVLLELNKWMNVDNLKIEQWIDLALSYHAVGESYTARQIYDNHIQRQIEHIDPYARIKGMENTDQALYASAKAAYLALLIDSDDHHALFTYIKNHSTKELIFDQYTYRYVAHILEGKQQQDLSFTYTYMGQTQNVILSNGQSFHYEVPSQNMDDFIISDPQGNMGAWISYQAPFDQGSVQNSSMIQLKRTYTHHETGREQTQFEVGDIIKITLSWQVEDLVNGMYEITDRLPAGLKAVQRPYAYISRDTRHSYINAKDQQVKMSLYSGYMERENQVTYYARVINPGTYRSEGAYIQLSGSEEILTKTQDENIKIRP